MSHFVSDPSGLIFHSFLEMFAFSHTQGDTIRPSLSLIETSVRERERADFLSLFSWLSQIKPNPETGNWDKLRIKKRKNESRKENSLRYISYLSLIESFFLFITKIVIFFCFLRGKHFFLYPFKFNYSLRIKFSSIKKTFSFVKINRRIDSILFSFTTWYLTWCTIVDSRNES